MTSGRVEPAIDRFERLYVIAPSGCWIWLGYVSKWGYGAFSLGGGRGQQAAHRWSHERFIGPIPAGYEVDHLCRVHRCVNFQHLQAVTKKVNGLRGTSLPARNARRTHCQNGHEFNSINTYQRPNGGGRQCRTCKRTRPRKSKEIQS